MTYAQLCIHGELKPHPAHNGQAIPNFHSVIAISAQFGVDAVEHCPGGALLPSDSLVVAKEDGEWPEWAVLAAGLGMPWSSSRLPSDHEMAVATLDALAAARPGRES